MINLMEVVRRLPGRKRIVITLAPGRYYGMSMYGRKAESIASERRFQNMLRKGLESGGVLNLVQWHNGGGMYYHARLVGGKWYSDPVPGQGDLAAVS